PPGSGWEHGPDPPGGARAGSRAAPGALGPGQRRPRPSGAAQWRSGYREIAPRARAERTGGERAPGVADTVSMFALSPEHRPVSADRSVRARGAAFRPARDPAAETHQARRACGAVWPATGRDRTPPGEPPVSAAASGLCSPEHVTGAAEAADHARPADHPAAHRGPATRALCDGRPTLGGSHHAGVSHAPGRSRSYRPRPGPVDLSARLQPP